MYDQTTSFMDGIYQFLRLRLYLTNIFMNTRSRRSALFQALKLCIALACFLSFLVPV
jgi:hypothetical protein